MKMNLLQIFKCQASVILNDFILIDENESKLLKIVVDVLFKIDICVVCPFIDNVEYDEENFKFDLVVLE